MEELVEIKIKLKKEIADKLAEMLKEEGLTLEEALEKVIKEI